MKFSSKKGVKNNVVDGKINTFKLEINLVGLKCDKKQYYRVFLEGKILVFNGHTFQVDDWEHAQGWRKSFLLPSEKVDST